MYMYALSVSGQHSVWSKSSILQIFTIFYYENKGEKSCRLLNIALIKWISQLKTIDIESWLHYSPFSSIYNLFWRVLQVNE